MLNIQLQYRSPFAEASFLSKMTLSTGKFYHISFYWKSLVDFDFYDKNYDFGALGHNFLR